MAETTPSMAQVRVDFDRIAQLGDVGWDHNRHYHPFLLRQLSGRCREVLEVGCGTGAFARALAPHADRVLALDLSPEMVRIARGRSARYPNIAFEVADVTSRQLPADRYDAVASIATLHHLPFEATLSRLARSLKPGGTLLVLDLYDRSGPGDRLMNLAAVPMSCAWRLARCGRLREPAEARRIWAEHGRHDVYMKFEEIRRTANELFPGAVVRRHLFWRYSLVWRKPLRGQDPTPGRRLASAAGHPCP
jgi:SAM-dependent methyltransferase